MHSKSPLTHPTDSLSMSPPLWLNVLLLWHWRNLFDYMFAHVLGKLVGGTACLIAMHY